ncbi:MAG: hypothetical protein ABIA02_03260 [Candidatus Falkowbacteria bacterium]
MDEEIKKLMQQNLKLTQEIHGMVSAVKKHMLWQKIFSILKILIIVVPIVLGFMYLPGILKDVTAQYKDLLGTDVGFMDLLKGDGLQSIKSININDIPPELLDKLNK